MSIRNLDAIFKARSIALVGAGTREHSVGAVTLKNLLSSGFGGELMLVNTKHDPIAGRPVYPDIKSLPATPDLAVICTPPATVPGLIAELGARGTKGAIVVTAGFGEGGSEQGRALETEMLNAAEPHLLRIIGPNCLGVLSTPIGLNASFAQRDALKGHVALVAQSGAIVTTVLDWATARGLGFSHLVSLGDMADVDFGDMLDYLANDPGTSAILLYIEAITHARKFMSAARAAARLKPVIAIKSGREAAAARAASSHTGALAGIDSVYDAAFERAGIVRALDLDEIFDAVETLALRPRINGDRLAILTNGGGVGVLATDALISQKGELAELSQDTIAKLSAALPPTWSHGDPVDIIGDADGTRYATALKLLAADSAADAILVLNCPTAVASSAEAAHAVVDSLKGTDRAVLTSWLGSDSAEESRRLFIQAGIPTYDTPEKAVRGFMHLVRYQRGQEMLREVPPSLAADFEPDDGKARQIIETAVAAGGGWLDPIAVQDLLNCYRIPTVRSVLAATPEEAAQAAAKLGTTVALKIQSPDITHKSDVGGVVLNLEGEDSVRLAAQAMQKRVTDALPQARQKGFLLQEMVRKPGAFELILGMADDATFGPFLLFGQGGTAVEVIADKSVALPPLNLRLAHEMIESTRLYRQLRGYRDQKPVALEAIASILVQLSELVCEFGEIVELDINPLLADANGVIALDARVKIARANSETQGSRLAIKPYPRELARKQTIPDLGEFLLRPVRPEDAGDFVKFFAELTPEDIRLRFFSPLRTLPDTLLARLTQIDYDREMAFVLFDDAGKIAGVVRYAADPDNVEAEYAVLVRSNLKGRGLGHLLMLAIIDYARVRGIQEIFGDILSENTSMLAVARDLGCTFSSLPGTLGIQRASLKLQEPAPTR
ncbi:MAG: bifunctional acetate--CoA ligase family protein/GNAT family N-acetyltransferase [Proteobacteria bacterium]|nr:bifunctional acetate--CoA ligase family protein/GNAT family N-acetyltransferase [Pseudomonadota bacterium]